MTPVLRNRLLANGRLRDIDHVPVVKFFIPIGAATWLASNLDEDGDTLVSLADLGLGCPELRVVQPVGARLCPLALRVGD